jgi:hypothetical protein
MKKLLLMAMAISLISCEKEDLNDNNSGSNNPTPYTIVVSYDSFPYQLYYCRFTYYDVSGNYYSGRNETDRTVENVDMSRPFKVEAQAGISMYQPGGVEIQNPLATDWQVKQDGVVIDAREAVNYVYQN